MFYNYKLLNLAVLFVLALFTGASNVAAEPVPGDSCASYPAGAFMTSGGPELGGVVWWLSCEAGIWVDSSCVEVGTVCRNGSIYAGLSPDGNVPMFTTPADAGAFSWNDGSSNWVDTGMQDCTSVSPGAQASCQTGEANTALLVALGTTPSPAPYVAARHCDNLDAHGQTDWYLPSQDELNVLWVNRAAIGGFNVTGSWPDGWYWSSSEYSINHARNQRFSDGFQDWLVKYHVLSVRCVRR